MTIAERLAWARGRLTDAGIPHHEAVQDADLLARHVLRWTRAHLLAERGLPASDAFTVHYEELVARRAAREPAAYIIGRQAFWTFDLEVTPAVLIPRPETELIVEEALACLAPARRGRMAERPVIVDIGTGSGCIALALAIDAGPVDVIAIDTSADALALARRNAERYGAGTRITFLHADLCEGVPDVADLIVSNPPYVPTPDIETLAPEVRGYEPRAALDGGADGLDVIRRLIADSPTHLRADGRLILECGYGQADAVRMLIARETRLELEAVRADLQGIPRVFVARRT